MYFMLAHQNTCWYVKQKKSRKVERKFSLQVPWSGSAVPFEAPASGKGVVLLDPFGVLAFELLGVPVLDPFTEPFGVPVLDPFSDMI